MLEDFQSKSSDDFFITRTCAAGFSPRWDEPSRHNAAGFECGLKPSTGVWTFAVCEKLPS